MLNLNLTRDGNYEFPISEVFTEYGGNDLFLFYIADSFTPIGFLVGGDSFEDAYANFQVIPRVEADVTLDALALADYAPDDVHYNDNGVPVDTESVEGWATPITATDFGYEERPADDIED